MITSVNARFRFGKNWRRYIEKCFSQERVDISKRHILSFLNVENLKGKTFIDIGCGSGLHSLAAFQAGADRIFSFDYDEESVRTTQYLHEKIAQSPSNWEIKQGSVLDEYFMKLLDKFDIVYSWGVLHHTGDQWAAISNASTLVKTGGLFYIALYSADVHKNPSPEFWLEVKKKYITSSRLRQNIMVLWYIWNFDMHRRPWRLPFICYKILNHKVGRGMSYITDIRDWIGGWPMEFSHDKDVINFVKEQLDLDLVKIKQGEANTEYLFLKH